MRVAIIAAAAAAFVAAAMLSLASDLHDRAARIEPMARMFNSSNGRAR